MVAMSRKCGAISWYFPAQLRASLEQARSSVRSKFEGVWSKLGAIVGAILTKLEANSEQISEHARRSMGRIRGILRSKFSDWARKFVVTNLEEVRSKCRSSVEETRSKFGIMFGASSRKLLAPRREVPHPSGHRDVAAGHVGHRLRLRLGAGAGAGGVAHPQRGVDGRHRCALGSARRRRPRGWRCAKSPVSALSRLPPNAN